MSEFENYVESKDKEKLGSTRGSRPVARLTTESILLIVKHDEDKLEEHKKTANKWLSGSSKAKMGAYAMAMQMAEQ